ncbi:unnamed protein product [Peronospora belbahrii]|uniref:Acyl-CoA dehydrogenase/oxidase C-terminal domain-containing protein n=1 Tax=Peronospora belbahrii TaxID=622444 RepID=A0AAU9L1R3_9STRA|nr:unnamed protein product [Peronospora belbahrii]
MHRLRYAIATGKLSEGRIGIAAQQLGITESVYHHATPYLFQWQQLAAIGDFQRCQHAKIAVELASARLLVYNAAQLKDVGHDVAQASCMARLHASRVAERTSSRYIELLGGVGVPKQLMTARSFTETARSAPSMAARATLNRAYRTINKAGARLDLTDLY